VSANTQINKLSMPSSSVLETIIAHGAHSWQIQLTVAMGRAADRPDGSLQPYDLLELFPMLERLARALQGSRTCCCGRATTSATSVRTSRRCAARCRAAITSDAAPGVWGIGIEADGTIKGCPSMATETGAAATCATAASSTSGSARRVRFNRGRTVGSLWGYCRELLLRRRVQGRLHVDRRVAARQAGQQPDVSSPRARDAAQGKRERLVRSSARRPAVRSGPSSS
jgi:hypothetical protein